MATLSQLRKVINAITGRLDYLFKENLVRNEEYLGECTALVEVLEMLQAYGDAHALGLDYKIEERYNIGGAQ